MGLSLPLSIEGVLKFFGKRQVLQDVSLSVQPGEILGLIGLNGAGKTTLIKIVLNLLNAGAGNVTFFGEAATSPISRRHISFLPEKFTPSPLLKGHEFLSLSLGFYNKPYDKECACRYATALGLDNAALERRVDTYSKGMGQKLGLISVFLSDAPLMILDEPMSGLDPSARIQLKNLLQAASKEGRSIFFSSHILSDIEEICDRIAILHESQIVFTGTPEEFTTRYPGKSLERAFLEAIDFAA
ncbi:MAG: transporter family protein [Rickettsiales bacterium]|jgi:ABC-2 type transport system ATP-binding protein|nr:transporter family protein [Rickettsiales bacterium]